MSYQPFAPNSFSPIESPCIKICEMNVQTKQCRGCYRTIDEIAYWATMSTPARRRVMVELAKRAEIAKGGTAQSAFDAHAIDIKF